MKQHDVYLQLLVALSPAFLNPLEFFLMLSSGMAAMVILSFMMTVKVMWQLELALTSVTTSCLSG